jgi:signal transduction histidine kinase
MAPVAGDPGLLDRVVQNLVDNATFHNQAGGWIRVATGPAEGEVLLDVSNSGRVLAPDELDHLFEPFHRASGTAGRGSGLGLSIVRAAVHAHGGSVSAEPLEPGGLQVWVRLPAATEGAARPAEPSV